MGKDIWPFNEPQNVAVFTIRQIVSEGNPILYVSHDIEDGAWQFLNNENVDINDAMIVSLEEIFILDKSISELSDLPLGWKAYRQSVEHPWRRFKD